MAGRRANGEGTIYRRKDGRYEAAVYLTTVTGARKRVRFLSKTREEAHEKLVTAKAQEQQGFLVADRDWKLGEYLDYWLESIVRKHRRPATYAQCEIIVRLYLKPELGSVLLSRLSVPMLQNFINRKLDEGHSIPKMQTVRKVLSSALTSAMREELLTKNAARLVVFEVHHPDEVKPWSIDEAKKFLRMAQSHSLYAAFVLLVLYGLRRGEVLGLRWCDVDMKAHAIHIRQQLLRVNGGLHQGSLKTHASKRDLPILDVVRDALALQKRNQVAACAAAGRRWQGVAEPEQLVVTTASGLPIEPSNLARSFHRICRRHGIRIIRLHDLRHTAATMLMTLGVSDKDIQKILGHARITVTREIYEHSDIGRRVDALSKVAERLFVEDQGSSRCRQLLPSKLDSIVDKTSFVSGGATGTRTLDLFHAMSFRAPLNGRLQSVKAIMKDRTRQWLLGAVAVTTAVNDDKLLQGEAS